MLIDFEQLKSIEVIFADLGQVKDLDFKQVKNLVVMFSDFEQVEKLVLLLWPG